MHTNNKGAVLIIFSPCIDLALICIVKAYMERIAHVEKYVECALAPSYVVH